MKNRIKYNLAKLLYLPVLVIILFFIPLIAKGYWLHVLILFVIDIILVTSYRMITTFGGWSFAHIVTMGVGGYTSALLTTKFFNWSFWLTLPIGGLMAAFFALIISYPCLRTRGFYFFLSTFAAGEAMRQLWIRFNFFGAFLGIPSILSPNPIFGISFSRTLPKYYLVLVIALLSVFILYRLDNSRIGNTIKAIRSSEDICESIGINTLGYKVSIFGISSFFAGIAGVLFAHYNGMIAPLDFTVIYMYRIITASIIGGTITFWGPLIGLVFTTGITELFRDLLDWVPFVYGIIIIGVLLFLPEGLESLPKRLSKLIKKLNMMDGIKDKKEH